MFNPSPCPVPASTKVCTKCKTEKALSEFHAHSMGRFGKRAACKVCQQNGNKPWLQANRERGRNYARRWREANPDKLNECQVKYLETAAGRAKSLWHAAHQRRPEGFTLTKEHVVRGVEKGFCPITGFKFDLSARYRSRSDRSKNPYAPSLDRLDNKKGYADENVIVVCAQVNMMRGEMSYPELAHFCRAILQHGSAAL